LTTTLAVRRETDLEPRSSGSALAFFQFRDLLGNRPLVVLGWRRGTWSLRFLPPGETLVSGWASLATAQGRDFIRAAATAVNTSGRTLQDFLPEALARSGEDRTLESSEPWYIYPDGRLNELSFEMLPQATDARRLFGEDRPVQYMLRPQISPKSQEAVELSRGWLGLGGVPAAGLMAELAGSLQEVLQISRLFREKGHRADTLTGKEARADRLEEQLAKLRPAILHIASHGLGDPTSPDSCALLLADSPDRPERELLPFRRIRGLHLAGIDLVVLSACSSSKGKSSRSVGLEGLAWAFLWAGASQVLATRYSIDDNAAVTFMTTFYKYLLQGLPAPKALGRTRGDSLRDRMPLREVGAWSLFC
jgi:hypothetical protein